MRFTAKYRVAGRTHAPGERVSLPWREARQFVASRFGGAAQADYAALVPVQPLRAVLRALVIGADFVRALRWCAQDDESRTNEATTRNVMPLGGVSKFDGTFANHNAAATRSSEARTTDPRKSPSSRSSDDPRYSDRTPGYRDRY